MEKFWRVAVPGGGVIADALVGTAIGFPRTARDGLHPLLSRSDAIPELTLASVIPFLFIGRHELKTTLMAFLICFVRIAAAALGIVLRHAPLFFQRIFAGRDERAPT